MFTETVTMSRSTVLYSLADTRKIMINIHESTTEPSFYGFYVKHLYDHLITVHAHAEEAEAATHTTIAANHSPPHLYPLLWVQ
jgi:hypothetical protein